MMQPFFIVGWDPFIDSLVWVCAKFDEICSTCPIQLISSAMTAFLFDFRAACATAAFRAANAAAMQRTAKTVTGQENDEREKTFRAVRMACWDAMNSRSWSIPVVHCLDLQTCGFSITHSIHEPNRYTLQSLGAIALKKPTMVTLELIMA